MYVCTECIAGALRGKRTRLYSPSLLLRARSQQGGQSPIPLVSAQSSDTSAWTASPSPRPPNNLLPTPDYPPSSSSPAASAPPSPTPRSSYAPPPSPPSSSALSSPHRPHCPPSSDPHQAGNTTAARPSCPPDPRAPRARTPRPGWRAGLRRWSPCWRCRRPARCRAGSRGGGGWSCCNCLSSAIRRRRRRRRAWRRGRFASRRLAGRGRARWLRWRRRRRRCCLGRTFAGGYAVGTGSAGKVWTSGNGAVGRTDHEVTFRETQLIRQPFLVCIPRGPIDLVIVVVQPRDVDAGELGDFTCRPADAAADIEDFHAFAQAHHVCEVVLMAGDGLVEAFAVGKAAEVEGAAPAVFVDVCCEVVVAVRGGQYALTHCSVYGGSRSTHCLVRVAYSALRSWSMGQFNDGLGMLPSSDPLAHVSDLLRFGRCGFVVPMLEVFLDGCFLRRGVFLQHGPYATFLLCAFAMEDFVVGCVPVVVFRLKPYRAHGREYENSAEWISVRFS